MKLHTLAIALGLVGIAAVAAGCRGGSDDFTRSGSSQSSVLQPKDLGSSTCPGTSGNAPGPYTVFQATGNIKNGAFTLSAESAKYFVFRMTPDGSNPPKPAPQSATKTGPTPRPTRTYFGTFTLNRGTSGCVVLLTSVNGTPIARGVNAVLTAVPNIAAEPSRWKLLASGPMKLTLNGFPATGSDGSFTLLTKSGKRYRTGSIEFFGYVVDP